MSSTHRVHSCKQLTNELQAAQQDDRAGTERAGAAGWSDLDLGAECSPVQGAASRSVCAVLIKLFWHRILRQKS